MFDNIGSKIKKLATILAVCGIVASIIDGVLILKLGNGTVGSIITGIALIIAGPLISWVSSFFVYGFGQLIENTEVIAENSEKKSVSESNKELKKTAVENDAVIVSKTPVKEVRKAETAEESGDYRDFECPDCGETLSFAKEEVQEGIDLYCPFCNAELHVGKK